MEGRQRSRYNVGNDEASRAARTHEGRTFASEAEMYRYLYLKGRQDRGEIQDLSLQPNYFPEIDGMRMTRYIADFRYTENGREVIEDVKGVLKDDTKIKLRLMAAALGKPVRLISRNKTVRYGERWYLTVGKKQKILESLVDFEKEKPFVP